MMMPGLSGMQTEGAKEVSRRPLLRLRQQPQAVDVGAARRRRQHLGQPGAPVPGEGRRCAAGRFLRQQAVGGVPPRSSRGTTIPLLRSHFRRAARDGSFALTRPARQFTHPLAARR